jgi:hypothetical protein
MRRGDAYPDHVSVYDFKTTLFLTGTTAIKFYVACPKESNKEPVITNRSRKVTRAEDNPQYMSKS